MFQLGSALLDGCVLAVLAREDAYGYSLTQGIKQVIPVSESTLYPVLRRLQNEHLLTTYDQPHSGRNRRYYRITDAGRLRLNDTKTAWTTFKVSVDSLLLDSGGLTEEAKPAKKKAATKAKPGTKKTETKDSADDKDKASSTDKAQKGGEGK